MSEKNLLFGLARSRFQKRCLKTLKTVGEKGVKILRNSLKEAKASDRFRGFHEDIGGVGGTRRHTFVLYKRRGRNLKLKAFILGLVNY